ncbi:MAG: helix-turn-helix domain-containing protein [Actinomycetota bacterium]|nr:helix-turn-helix domain-containing protein [Actinomycetota bacterium]
MAAKRAALARARKATGLSQETLADALGVDPSTVRRWEAGDSAPQPWLRPGLADLLGVNRDTLAELLTLESANASMSASTASSVIGQRERIQASQEDWLHVRRAPGVRGRELTELAAWLYPETERALGGHVLTGPGWLMETPVGLDAVRLQWEYDAPAFTFPDSTLMDELLPLTDSGTRYGDYGRAVRDLVRPRLLENRPSYRLTTIDASPHDGLKLSFGRTTFFEVFNLKQMVAHEFKRAWLQSGRQIPSLDELPLRAAIGSPFNPDHLLMSPGVNTLTIRRGGIGDGPSFVLHERDGGKVADGGGLCHVMPAGEFQPSSANLSDVRNDFSVWRNIMREFSEEFLGNPEHDGSGPRSIDYKKDEPFAQLERARRQGTLQLWHYGLAVEPLELGVMQLTVAVVDAREFDKLFADMVDVNDEGQVIGRGGARYIPFTDEAIRRLDPRLSASALTLLKLAWRDRGVLLD